MKNPFLLLASWFILSCQGAVFGQIQLTKDTSDLTFTGTRINPYQIEYDSTGKFTLSGYIESYGAFYTDTVSSTSGYAKFPTSAPRSNQFGLNIAQLSMKYESKDFHGTATLFYGDIPDAAWSPKYSMIQEANLGFRVYKKLWLDAGYFRTHIGLESIQPRENIALSLATTTYFEPYFLSGAKLTWVQSKKWSFQLNAFNGFNTYEDNNANKAFGVSVSYSPNDRFSTTFNSLVCDESPDGFNRPQARLYNNLIGIYKSNRWTLGYEFNNGIQQNTGLVDTLTPAQMYSFLLAAKYRVTSKWAVYGRVEKIEDLSEMLTGPIENENHQLVGVNMEGITMGIEYKPIPNSYLRIEGRWLQAAPNEKIFYYQGQSRNHREEILIGLGVWF